MSALRAALDDYLRIRRRLGFEMPQDGRLLEGFVEFLEQAGAERISTELALAWARMPVDAHPSRWGQRLGVARGFARHLATIDPASEVPPTDHLPGHRPRIAPYIYSEAEIAALMTAARELRPRLRASRHETLIGLLVVTGMRPGEALALDRQDVDLRHGVVHVRAGKQKKQREVPLRESTISALGAYAGRRDARFPTPSTPAFFISARGRRMRRAELNQTFIKLIGEVGLEGRGARARPRPHDLRHAFAVHTLLDWYGAGVDIDRRMPLLSTYLGHADPASTYWYLEAVPELLELIGRRLEQLPGVLS
ncbi:MAG: tyrosine-type recombinase/integrase [Actinobacteria bacterium]|nr:tyrosine-type recombinase/integrase [Actinomycetota bacterium]MCA1697525.1 tyrosine-type recombinase/integrase [Actinomycetota bacterium]